MAENKTLEHLPEVRAAVAALSPEDRELLEAVQASPFKLTAPEQFKEFAANIDYFVFEPNIHDLFHTQIGVGNRLDGGRRRVKKYLWSFFRTAPAGQVRL